MGVTKSKKTTRGRPAAKKSRSTRYRVKMQVDYSSGENFLFSYIDNISEVGIFLSSMNPLKPGTCLTLRFPGEGSARSFSVKGQVVWINPYNKNGENLNPGMGIRFVGVTEEQKTRIQDLIKTIAYIHENWI
jgi:type IV pilus assembly protein PilZ